MNKIILNTLLSNIKKGDVKITTFEESDKEIIQRKEAAMNDYEPLIKQV